MPVDSFKILRLTQKRIKELDQERTSKKLSIDYKDPKEAMLNIYIEYQTIVSQTKGQHIKDKVALACIKLAAAAIKYATDLGDPIQMGLEDKLINEATSV